MNNIIDMNNFAEFNFLCDEFVFGKGTCKPYNL